jgi:hypothetical protein
MTETSRLVNSEAEAIRNLLLSGPGEPESKPAPTSPADHATKPAPAPSKPDDGALSAEPKSAEQFAAEAKAAAVADMQRFTAAFGPQGAIWFCEGKSFAQSQQLVIESLRKERDELTERLKQIGLKDTALLGLIPRA